MPYSTSTLCDPQSRDVFGENDPLSGARHRRDLQLKIAFSRPQQGSLSWAVTKSTASRRDQATHLNSDISHYRAAEFGAMAGWSAGIRPPGEAPALRAGPISSLRRTAGSPPFISFSTSYPELDSAAHDTRMTNVFRQTRTVSVAKNLKLHSRAAFGRFLVDGRQSGN